MPKRRVKRHSVTQPPDKTYRLIPLTQGQKAIVDSEDFEWLSRWNWQAMWSETSKGFYAKRGSDGVMMHSQILKCGPRECDHINHDTLDNRRSNLRRCSQKQNLQNTGKRSMNKSGFKGVVFRKLQAGKKQWYAYTKVNGRQKCLGYFLTKEEAARAYDSYVSRHHGEFAVLNFPLTFHPSTGK